MRLALLVLAGCGRIGFDPPGGGGERAYPEQWLVVEALEAHTTERLRILDKIAVVETCSDGAVAFKRYRELRRARPEREWCFVHTANVELEIVERFAEMQLSLRDELPFAAMRLTHGSDTIELANVLVDTGFRLMRYRSARRFSVPRRKQPAIRRSRVCSRAGSASAVSPRTAGS